MASERCRNRLQNDVDVDKIVRDQISIIFDRVDAEISRAWIETIDIGVACDVAMIKMKRLVAWATIEHDGKLSTEPGSVLEEIVHNGEPQQLIIDPWARATGTAASTHDFFTWINLLI